MKHKTKSLTVSKIISIFDSKLKQENIVAIIRPIVADSQPLKFILSSHLEILMLQLSHKTLQLQDFILQKFYPSPNYYYFSAKFSLPDIITSAKPLSNKYLINGKYLNQELSKAYPEPELFDPLIQNCSQEVIKYLCKYHGKILSCELEWFQDLSNNYYLVDILNVTEGVTLAGKRIIRSVSENIPPNKLCSRPITARSNEKSFRFTPNTTHNHTDITRLIHDSFTTPKAFKLSYEYKNKHTQTLVLPCCQNNFNLIQCKEELVKAIERKQMLETLFEKIKEENEKKLEEIDKNWKNKCLEISNSMADKMHLERKKYENKIKALKNEVKML